MAKKKRDNRGEQYEAESAETKRQADEQNDELEEEHDPFAGPQPENLIECFAQLDADMPPASREKLRNMTQDDLTNCHFGFGLYLRNRYLWTKASRLMPLFKNLHWICHQDSASSFLTMAYWMHLNGTRFDEASLEKLLREEHMIWDEEQLLKPRRQSIQETVRRLLGKAD